jgi:hypothetical protein
MSRFDGAIAGLGTTSGTRVVLGMWPDSPFGPIVDTMVERANGWRLLIAPRADVAEYIAGTYRFDEVRVEASTLRIAARTWAVDSRSLHVELQVGRRTLVGVLLGLVPRAVARSRWWCRLIDPLARRLRQGVRTVGTAGNGRREYYCTLDEHHVTGVRAVLDAADLGQLRPVAPPVHFGFGSTPYRPSLVRVTTLVDDGDAHHAGDSAPHPTGRVSLMTHEDSPRTEDDTAADPARADSRATGGVTDGGKPDQGSTTGTTPDDEYVGRVAGQDVGYEEETGAERRAE